jgi:6-phosphogluconolactonase/glucosamine-6-phosphate isomerase/deaminase
MLRRFRWFVREPRSNERRQRLEPLDSRLRFELLLLGVGVNGHAGFNEQGVRIRPWRSRGRA